MKFLHSKSITLPSILLFPFILSACHSTPTSQIPASSQHSSSSSQELYTDGEQSFIQHTSDSTSTSQQTQSTLNLSEEPPLSQEDMEIAVPDFLTDEQQMLYRRAHNLYEHLNGDSIEYSETLEMETFPPKEYKQVTINHMVYIIAQGRYANWTDFETVGNSIFTKDCWKKLNMTSDGLELRTEYEDKLCFLDTAIGGGYYFCENIPDTFRLDKQEENEITFTLIGHYRYFDEITDTDRQLLDTQGYNYTLEFPIKMVLTDNGWRFDEFHSSLRDEREPIQSFYNNIT